MIIHKGRIDERLLRRRRRVWTYLVLIGLAVFFLFPLVFMFVSSLKPDGQILSDVGGWRAFLPLGDIGFDNYSAVFDRVPVGRFLLNSVLVTVVIVGAGFAAVAILTFLPAWIQYLWPSMVVQDEKLRPVMVGMQYFFQDNTAWGEVMAYTSMITLPVLVVFLAFQRAFVSSVAASGVKE